MNLDSVGQWIAVVAFLFQVVIISWGIFRYLNRIEKRLDTIEAEYKPNHGSSMRDAINRIERSISKLEGRFEQHVSETEE